MTNDETTDDFDQGHDQETGVDYGGDYDAPDDTGPGEAERAPGPWSGEEEPDDEVPEMSGEAEAEAEAEAEYEEHRASGSGDYDYDDAGEAADDYDREATYAEGDGNDPDEGYEVDCDDDDGDPDPAEDDAAEPCYPDSEPVPSVWTAPKPPTPTVEELLAVGEEVGTPSDAELATGQACHEKVRKVSDKLKHRWIPFLDQNGHSALNVSVLKFLYEEVWRQHLVAEGGNVYRYGPAEKHYVEITEQFKRELVEHGEALADECRQVRVAAGAWDLKDAATILKALPKAPGGEETVTKCRVPLTRLWTQAGRKMNSVRKIVNMQNGLLNLKTLELRPHSAKHLGTIRLPYDFIPGADCPLFKKALAQMMPNPAIRSVFVEFLGYGFLATTILQKAAFLTGEGANGKSTLIGLLPYLYGKENCSAVPIEELGAPFRSAALRDKLVNLTSELDTSRPFNDAKFKACVAGDAITGERKYQDPSMFTPFVKFFVACNELPRVKVDGPAFYRRLLLFHFDQKFVASPNPNAEPPEHKADPGLLKKLRKELPGIFNLAMEGLARLDERGDFAVPPELEANVEEYKRDNNNALRFLHEACEFGPGCETSSGDLYRAYAAWCTVNGEKPKAQPHFARDVLRQQGVRLKPGKSKGRRYEGVCPATGSAGVGDLFGARVAKLPTRSSLPTQLNARRGKLFG